MDRISYNQRLHKAQMSIVASVEALVGTTQGLTLPAASKRDADHRNLMSWEHLAAWLAERATDFTSDGFGAGDAEDGSVSDGLDDMEVFEADEVIDDADDGWDGVMDPPDYPLPHMVEDPEDETPPLDTLTLAELRELAEAAGIEVSGRRKADYIEALQAHGAQ